MREMLISFFELTARLKEIDLAAISSPSAPPAAPLTFFLNLYHLIVNHAYLVFGPPASKFAWCQAHMEPWPPRGPRAHQPWAPCCPHAHQPWAPLPA